VRVQRGRLGIDRGNYIAIRTPDPEAAAKFATDHMGFTLVHVDDEKRHYLRAWGLDQYSLVYTEGEDGIDHISYLVRGKGELDRAHETLLASGTEVRRKDQPPLWRHGPAIRFDSPSGAKIELTTGVNLEVPMGWTIMKPPSAPAPINFDHAVVRAVDVQAEMDFATDVMGLRESGRILGPDGSVFLAFFRAHTIYHCFAVAGSPYNGLHHLQFTHKHDMAIFEAEKALKASGVEPLWGPLRHGAGENIAMYFHDYAKNIVEYSAEEEIILNGETYVANVWPFEDHRAVNEWGASPPPETMR
jgi:catechol 2,3-dioxygenase